MSGLSPQFSRHTAAETVISQNLSSNLSCERTPLLQPQARNSVEITSNGFSMRGIYCQCRQSLAGRSILVDFLAICFGIGAWIAINGMFVQLPLLVQTQPEGWNLPSYLTVIIQIANIGPIVYSISKSVFGGRIRDSFVIYGVLLLGTVALLLMSFFYEVTTIVGGKETSTALFILVFFIALVGCTSSVLFMPYMGKFREIYLISYFVGEGLSGFLPSVVALGQGVGGNPTCVNQTDVNGTSSLVPYTPPPNFSTQVFFLFLFATLALSTLAFFLLNNLQECKKEKVTKASKNSSATKQDMIRIKDNNATRSHENTDLSEASSIHSTDLAILPFPVVTKSIPLLSRSKFVYLLSIQTWVCLLGNGVFPSIQSYSSLPYGNIVYHLTATLGSMANPMACFLAFFLPISSISLISVLTSLTTLVSSYIMATALLSPEPPLVNTSAGEILVVLAWILNTGLISYIKLSVASLFRRDVGRALFWCGAIGQLGSAIGAVVTFFLVNYTDLFEAYYPCL